MKENTEYWMVWKIWMISLASRTGNAITTIITGKTVKIKKKKKIPFLEGIAIRSPDDEKNVMEDHVVSGADGVFDSCCCALGLRTACAVSGAVFCRCANPGGGYVCWSTVTAVISLRKVTAGVLVVLAPHWHDMRRRVSVGCDRIFHDDLWGGTGRADDGTHKKNAVRDLISLVPPVCRKYIDKEYREVSIKTVRPGDVLKVIPGERIPVDGVIIKGRLPSMKRL